MAGQGLGDANLGYRVDNKAATDVVAVDQRRRDRAAVRRRPTGGGIPTPGHGDPGRRAVGLHRHRPSPQIDPQTFVLRLDRPLGNLPTPPGGDNGDRIKLTVPGGGPGGAAYTRTINVLQGDVDKSGSVVANDFSDVKKKFFKSTTNPGWATRATPCSTTWTATARSSPTTSPR